MTMQAVLIGTDGIVLASDLKWAYNNATHRYGDLFSKIKISDGGNVAVSYARCMEVSGLIADAVLQLDDSVWENPIGPLERVAQAVIDKFDPQRRDVHCLIVSAKRSTPVAYSLRSGRVMDGGDSWTVMCQEVFGRAIAGDDINSGVFWLEGYYRKLPMASLLPLVAQAIISASRVNSAAVEGLEIVTCSTTVRRLSQAETDELQARAKALDTFLEEAAVGRQEQDIKVDKGRFDAMLGKMLAMPPTPNAELKVGKRKKRAARKPRG